MAEKFYLDEETLEKIITEHYNDRFKKEAGDKDPDKQVSDVEFSYKRSEGVTVLVEFGEPIDFEIEESYNNLDFETYDQLKSLSEGGETSFKIVFEEE